MCLLVTRKQHAKHHYKGLNKSAIIQKISLDEAEAVTAKRNATGEVQVHVVNSNPMVINPNGKRPERPSFLILL